jgi:hypothetical protein
MTGEDYREASSFEDILFKANPFFINVNSWYTQGGGKEIYLRANEHITVAHFDDKGKLWVDHQMLAALIVVDSNPIGNSYEMIAMMPASEIVSVTFMKGNQGFSIYGSRAAGRVVFVTTKMAAKNIDGTYPEKVVRRDDDLLKQVRLFRTETEYYIPTKEEVSAMPEFQMRPTILWKTDLITDGSGTARIVYPNNLSKGTAMVFVNGVSLASQVGSKRFIYKVN